MENRGSSNLHVRKNNNRNRQVLSNGFEAFGNGEDIYKELRNTEYIKKMAMFRFGVTNTEKWRLG